MYAKFRILTLTLLVFVDVNLKAWNVTCTATEGEQTNSDRNVAVGVAVEDDIEDLEVVAQTANRTNSVDTTKNITLSKARARSIAHNNDDDDFVEHNLNAAHETQLKDTSRPLKNVFRGVYKSYKSTYMGNVTSAEYKKRLIERLNAATAHIHVSSTKPTLATKRAELSELHERLKNETRLPPDTEIAPLAPPALDAEALKAKLKETLRKRKRKYHRAHASAKRTKTNHRHSNATTTDADKVYERASHNNNNTANKINANEMPLESAQGTLNGTFSDKHYRYTIGPGVNMSFDMLNDIVNVNLDSDNLAEIMRGRWLNDNSEEGRGKKYDMITKVLPLFVLPFLIQSAIVPFLVTKLKLLLVKSILIGKLAIFLLILSAIKNGNKTVQSYEVAPSYWAGEPSRRSELAAAASSSAYNGYRVEGKPAAWIN
ncbi:uncharacterized protein LOC105233725 [Bactrocera dorsalis]|uniref:Uncharacterized protein LOC105233725 n=1 Tax=Bactrocera dorsalis TaxID=27457 RepID=A0A6I9VK64_BACDO|nr:uncharacterized protein LOC105233725 [Bactrocera dorsalis]